MCGIVGYIGVEKPIDVVLGGLEKLEYRGYDSAGISFLAEDDKLLTVKKEGRLANLAELSKRDGGSRGGYWAHTMGDSRKSV